MPLLAGGLMFIFVALLIDMRGTLSSTRVDRQSEICPNNVTSGNLLSEEQLARLLTVPERGSKTNVRSILQAPYCELSSLQIRAGVAAEREAYLLAVEPETWLIVLYEGDEYAGFQFRFQ
ncbi:hypothetical protein [Oculatella sp. LEGE 06141]